MKFSLFSGRSAWFVLFFVVNLAGLVWIRQSVVSAVSPQKPKKNLIAGEAPKGACQAVPASAAKTNQMASAQVEAKRGEAAGAPGKNSSPAPETKQPAERISLLSFRVSDLFEGGGAIDLGFSQKMDLDSLLQYVSIQPAVEGTLSAMTLYESKWNGYRHEIRLKGPFLPGKRYRVTFRKGLKSVAGLVTTRDLWRQAIFSHLSPNLSFPFGGRYLAPFGKLTVPATVMNLHSVTCSLSRVLAKNVVQFAMRDGGRYDRWNCYGDGSVMRDRWMAERITTPVSERVLLVPDAKLDQKTTLLVNLADFADKVEKGTYLLHLTASNDVSAARLVCVSDLGLSARRGTGTLTTWVTTLQKGSPKKGCKVSLYAENNTLLGTGVSDASGLVDFALSPDAMEKAYVLVAEDAGGADVTFLPLSYAQQVELTSQAKRPFGKKKSYTAFLMSDRDLYRPGETFFLQGLLREEGGRAPAATFPVVMEVRQPNGKVMERRTLLPDALGCVTQEVTVATSRPSGRYRVLLRMPGKDGAVLGERLFSVESFVPPQTKVSLSGLPDALYHQRKPLSVKVMAQHLFGAPAANARAELNVIYSSKPFSPKGWDGYLFGDDAKKTITKREEMGMDQTDANGRASFSVSFDDAFRPASGMEALFQATVLEPSGRPVHAAKGVPFHAYPFYIGLKTPELAMLRGGDQVQLSVALVTPDADRVKGSKPLSLRVEEIRNHYFLRKTDGGDYEWICDQEKRLVRTANVLSAADQDVVVPVSFPGCGDYVVTVADEKSGSSSSVAISTDWEGRIASVGNLAKPEEVEIRLDRKHYQPGENAQVSFRAPFLSGTAWVTVQQYDLVKSWVVPISNSVGRLTIPVDAKWMPNAELSVTAVSAVRSEQTWKNHRAAGLSLLRVCPDSRFLNVRVEPAGERWLPARELPVTIQVATKEGQVPDQAAVTVMVVDEGICLLTDFKTPDPNEFFFAPRYSAFPLFDVYRRLMPVYHDALLRSRSHAGGDGVGEMKLRLNPVAARRFEPLSRWRGNVALDAKGAAKVSIPIPEFAGAVRVMAVAWTAEASGSAEDHVRVCRPLVCRPDLPRMLAPGDTADLTISLNNESGSSCTAKLSFRAEGPVRFSQKQKTVTLAAGGASTFSIPVVAGTEAGKATLWVHVEGAGEPYEQRIELPVRPVSAWQVAYERLTLPPGQELTCAPVEMAMNGTFAHSILCQTPGVVDLSGALEYLVRYPYGCLEQTISSVLPVLMLDERQRAEWMRHSSKGSEMDDWIAEAVSRIASMRREAGFSMWPEVLDVNADATLYAAFFVFTAERAGYRFPVLDRAVVLDSFRLWLNMNESTLTLTGEAYACHVLALAGTSDLNRMARLTEQVDQLNDRALFHLARAWVLSGEIKEAYALLRRLSSVDTLQGAALGLLTWLEFDPAAPMVEVCRERIEAARTGDSGHWGNTQNNALAAFALAAYNRRFFRKEQSNLNVDLRVGTSADWVASGETNRWIWTPVVEDRAKLVTLKNNGAENVVVSRRMEYVPKGALPTVVDKGMVIRRTYHALSDGRELQLPTLRRGDAVVVALTLEMGRDASDLVIEDLLPACLEIERSDLGAANAVNWLEKDESDWVLHQETRDDRILLFSKPLSEKTRYQYHYVARVVTAGDFAVPAVEVSEMYNPNRITRVGSGRMNVR